MNETRKNLKSLIDFVTEISKIEENRWFRESLLNNLIESNNSTNNELNTELFIRVLRKNFSKKAKDFYGSFLDEKLRKDLISDYKEMLWYKTIGNIERQYLFIYYQLENMLNFYIKKNEAFEKILNNPNIFSIKFSDKFDVNCKTYFYSKNDIPIEINKISSIWAKLVFFAVDTKSEQWLLDKKKHFDNIIQLRNDVSHRNSTELNKFTLKTKDYLVKTEDGNHSYIIQILNSIKSKL